MGILIDIVALIILAVAVVLGYRKGLIRSVMGLVSLVLSVVLAINFYSCPAQYLKKNVIEPHFVSSTSDKISALMNGGTEVIPPEKVFEDEPDALVETADRFGLDVSDIQKYYEEAVKNVVDSFDVEEIAQKISEFIVGSAVDTISNILGFAAVFLASLIVLNLLLLLINLIFKLPVLKLANKVCGALLGAVKALIIIVVVVNVWLGLVTATTDSTTTGADVLWSVDAVTSSTSYKLVSNAGFIF